MVAIQNDNIEASIHLIKNGCDANLFDKYGNNHIKNLFLKYILCVKINFCNRTDCLYELNSPNKVIYEFKVVKLCLN